MSLIDIVAFALTPLALVPFVALVVRKVGEFQPPAPFRRAAAVVILQLVGVGGATVSITQLTDAPVWPVLVPLSFAQLFVVVGAVYRLSLGSALAVTTPLYFGMAALGWAVQHTGLVGVVAAFVLFALPAVRDVRFERRMRAIAQSAAGFNAR